MPLSRSPYLGFRTVNAMRAADERGSVVSLFIQADTADFGQYSDIFLVATAGCEGQRGGGKCP